MADHPCDQPDHSCDPDRVFACKLRYMRDNGGLNTKIPAGWGGPSLKVRADKMVEDGRKAGLDPVSVASRWI